jgi:hypothetical protein
MLMQCLQQLGHLPNLFSFISLRTSPYTALHDLNFHMPILFQDSFIRSPKTLKNQGEMGYMHVLCLFFTQIIYILVLVAETTANVPAIIVFGDSSVDAGNNNVISTVLKSNFKPYGRDFEGGRPTGRFCNGRIPPDFISEAFGLKPAIPAYLDSQYSISDFATGVCFASAGTGYDNATSNVLVSHTLSLFPFCHIPVYEEE